MSEKEEARRLLLESVARAQIAPLLARIAGDVMAARRAAVAAVEAWARSAEFERQRAALAAVCAEALRNVEAMAAAVAPLVEVRRSLAAEAARAAVLLTAALREHLDGLPEEERAELMRRAEDAPLDRTAIHAPGVM